MKITGDFPFFRWPGLSIFIAFGFIRFRYSQPLTNAHSTNHQWFNGRLHHGSLPSYSGSLKYAPRAFQMPKIFLSSQTPSVRRDATPTPCLALFRNLKLAILKRLHQTRYRCSGRYRCSEWYCCSECLMISGWWIVVQIFHQTKRTCFEQL